MLAFTSRKNVHLSHLEDVVLTDGPSGVTFALNVLAELGRSLNGGTLSRALTLSVKWDGAPAIIFGIDPLDRQFFVSTKSIFNVCSVMAKSHETIDKFWSGDLANVMHWAFDSLEPAVVSGVYQGDVLYTGSTLSSLTIAEDTLREAWSFRPNTITYIVPKESDLGRRIAPNGFGIAVHTVYDGGVLVADWGARPISDMVFSSFKPVPGVLLLNPAFQNGCPTFTVQASTDFALAAIAAHSWASEAQDDIFEVVQSEPLREYITRFFNRNVREGRRLAAPFEILDAFLTYLAGEFSEEIATKKTERGRSNVSVRYNTMYSLIRNNNLQLAQWFALHAAIARAKDIVVRTLATTSEVATYSNGDATAPEGYVLTMDGHTVKLVDRMEFSRLNFTVPRGWK